MKERGRDDPKSLDDPATEHLNPGDDRPKIINDGARNRDGKGTAAPWRPPGGPSDERSSNLAAYLSRPESAGRVEAAPPGGRRRAASNNPTRRPRRAIDSSRALFTDNRPPSAAAGLSPAGLSRGRGRLAAGEPRALGPSSQRTRRRGPLLARRRNPSVRRDLAIASDKRVEPPSAYRWLAIKTAALHRSARRCWPGSRIWRGSSGR